MVKALAVVGLAYAATGSLVVAPAAASTVLPNLPAPAYSLLVTATTPGQLPATLTRRPTPGTLGTSVAGASAGAEAGRRGEPDPGLCEQRDARALPLSARRLASTMAAAMRSAMPPITWRSLVRPGWST